MRIKLICCDVFARIVCRLASCSPHVVDLEFIPMLSHNEPAKLRKELQGRIDAVCEKGNCDILVLGYGLCGNSISGLKCGIPMVIPRIHDCCAMFMGSREGFVREFGQYLSARWCSNGYYERGYTNGSYDLYGPKESHKTSVEYLKMIEDYGEDNADYIWETMYPPIETDRAFYIKLDGYEYNDSQKWFESHVMEMGSGMTVLNGDVRLLDELVNGPWNEREFLRVSPGAKVVPVYDMDTVITEDKG